MTSFIRGVGDSITAAFGSPRKPASEEPAAAQMDSSLDVDSRKRKGDPYDEMPGGEGSILVAHGDDKMQQTPPGSNKSRRTTTTNMSMYAPGTGPRVKRRGRPSATPSEMDRTVDPRVDAPANLERALAPDAARLHPENDDPSSVTAAVPVADMGGMADPFAPQIKDKTETASSSPIKVQPIQKESEPETTTTREEAADDTRQEEQGDVAEVHALLEHKMLKDKSVDIKVHWQGEPAEEATWEPETQIQEGASIMLYDYWKAAGGRTETLFKTETEVYHVFAILAHEKQPRGGFKLKVQWVGYSADDGETSWEPEAKLRKIAPELLEEYWDSKPGGRSGQLSKRGRTKKN